MKYGLVLAGGGVRGAFQMGVWKALRKMNKELCAVAGTSIGAVNGALIAQDEYETALKMWGSISAGDIVALPEGMEKEKNIFSAKNFMEIAKKITEKGGLDLSPLEEILRGIIDEDKLRRSPVDFGAAAYSVTKKTGVYKFKNEIPIGGLVDFIMASASILTLKTVDDEKFSDGGMFDNMPAGMLTEKGIRDIITVNVRGVGINRGFSAAGKNIISISSKSPQTGIMDFDRGGIRRSMDEGYIECMRAFGQVQGDIYAFRAEDYQKAREWCGEEMLLKLQKAAQIFDISPLEIYTVDGLREMVLEGYYKQAQRGGLDFRDGVLEKIRAEGDNALVAWLVSVIENGKSDFLPKKLSVLGANYDAASAILYFKD